MAAIRPRLVGRVARAVALLVPLCLLGGCGTILWGLQDTGPAFHPQADFLELATYRTFAEAGAALPLVGHDGPPCLVAGAPNPTLGADAVCQLGLSRGEDYYGCAGGLTRVRCFVVTIADPSAFAGAPMLWFWTYVADPCAWPADYTALVAPHLRRLAAAGPNAAVAAEQLGWYRSAGGSLHGRFRCEVTVSEVSQVPPHRWHSLRNRRFFLQTGTDPLSLQAIRFGRALGE